MKLVWANSEWNIKRFPLVERWEFCISPKSSFSDLPQNEGLRANHGIGNCEISLPYQTPGGGAKRIDLN